MKILVATTNKNKLQELQTIAQRFSIELLSPKQVAVDLGKSIPEVEETADSFRGNALLKAETFAKWSGFPAIGDDSGLEVMALGGRPGIFSARYAGVGASDRQKCEKLLNELEMELQNNPHKNRVARFYCYLVLAFPDSSELLEADGELKGEVLKEPKGDKGFGYDPIIFIDSLGSTLSEVDFKVTCEKGFRAIAAEKLFSSVVKYCNK